MTTIRTPPEFVINTALGASNAAEWAAYETRFLSYLRIAGITDDSLKIEHFKYLAGEGVTKIYEFSGKSATTDKIENVLKIIREHFADTQNINAEVVNFLRTTQRLGENIDAYVTRLREKAATCEFGDQTAVN